MRYQALMIFIFFSVINFSAEAATYDFRLDESFELKRDIFKQSMFDNITLNPAKRLVIEGGNQLKRGNHKEGEVALLRALEIEPHMKEAVMLLAFHYLQIKSYDEALKFANKIQQLQPEESVGFLLAGLAYSGLDQKELAKKSFNEAVTIRPSDVNAWRNLAAYAMLEGQIELARSYYENASNIRRISY